jgi:hypothetical protein
MTAGRNIGGVLDLAALAALTDRDVTLARHATRHRPKDPEALRAAIHELRSRGLGDYDIAAATGMSVEIVRRTLGERSP